MRDSDVEACEEIYRLNESSHFPNGYFPRFSDWLRNRRALIVVAEAGGSVHALGGISEQEHEGNHVAGLSFGMVHPSHHRRGYGTALLLSRLSLLKTAKPASLVMLTTTRGSETFYGRFGFKHYHSLQATSQYREDHYFAKVSASDRSRCLAALAGLHLSPALFTMEVPSFASLTPLSSVAVPDA
ncbi:GNAT family N-acetyltransferase [Polaromonas sp. CT11-55]|uniref:GNAT family N-acetyltransferase n=1 Tax=Polaromonas sp. CT11-55 TaxID=3243045 RepID=UPI0039A59403